VVIAAGYPDEMREFISSNPGLESRFTTYVQFDDYSPTELATIFSQFASNQGMSLSEGARTRVLGVCQKMHASKGPSFGNARDIRNLFERVIRNFAARVAAGDTNLQEIREDDILDVPSNFGIPAANKTLEIGFRSRATQ